jgi:hypothetical protein
MRNIIFLFVIFLSTLLTGCGSWCNGWTQGGTRNMDGACGAVVKGNQNREQQQNQARINRLQSVCDGYGFKRGTTEYSQCLMTVESQNNAAASASAQQQQQLFNNAQQLLRGDGGGQVNCYPTPGVPGSTYCR